MTNASTTVCAECGGTLTFGALATDCRVFEHRGAKRVAAK